MATPAYNWPIDKANALAQYVKYWSWLTNATGSYATDVSGNAYHGVAWSSNREDSPVVVSGLTGANAGYNGTYAREASDYLSKPCYKMDANHWVSKQDATYMIIGPAKGAGWVSYATMGTATYPWQMTFSGGMAATVTRGADGWNAQWTSPGLDLRTALPERIEVPIASADQPGTGDFSLMLDVTITNTNTTWATTAFRWTDGTKLLQISRFTTGDWTVAPLRLYFRDGTVSITGDWTNATALTALKGTGTKRLWFAFDRDANATLWVNGVSGGTIAISTASRTLSGMGTLAVGSDSTNPTWSIGGNAHEVGYIKGYAVVADDVANNVAASTLHGLAAPLKSGNGLDRLSIKTFDGLAVASVKTADGLA